MNRGLLLDSNAFLWLLQEPEKLGHETMVLISGGKTLFVSLASIWELALKYQKQKLDFSPDELLTAVEAIGGSTLQISGKHIAATSRVNLSHKDPFDKMLVAQAEVENLTLVTADRLLLEGKLPFVVDSRR